jgi:sulfur carrier protein
MILVNGDPEAWTPGMTIRDVLKVKNYRFPLLVVSVDGTHVPPADYDAAQVPDGAQVQVMHLLSGG